MIPDFSHNIRIRLAQLKFYLMRPDVAKSLSYWLSQFWKAKLRQRLSNVWGQQKNSIGSILFLHYKESLVSSNLNSKQLKFHGAHHYTLNSFLRSYKYHCSNLNKLNSKREEIGVFYWKLNKRVHRASLKVS